MAQGARILARPVSGSVLSSSLPNAPRPVAADYLALPALPSIPYQARRLTASFLESRGISGEPAEDAELVMSELATNAVQEARRLGLIGTALIQMSLRQFGNYLLMEVADPSPAFPLLRDADADATSGRGLLIVSELAHEWGYFPLPGGKMVYCSIEVLNR